MMDLSQLTGSQKSAVWSPVQGVDAQIIDRR